jgi:hypothetical protein
MRPCHPAKTMRNVSKSVTGIDWAACVRLDCLSKFGPGCEVTDKLTRRTPSRSCTASNPPKRCYDRSQTPLRLEGGLSEHSCRIWIRPQVVITGFGQSNCHTCVAGGQPARFPIGSRLPIGLSFRAAITSVRVRPQRVDSRETCETSDRLQQFLNPLRTVFRPGLLVPVAVHPCGVTAGPVGVASSRETGSKLSIRRQSSDGIDPSVGERRRQNFTPREKPL